LLLVVNWILFLSPITIFAHKVSDMTRKAKSENRQTIYLCDQQITLSMPKLCVIGLMGTITDVAVKPFSWKHFSKHLKWLKRFSTLTGLVLTPGNARTFRGRTRTKTRTRTWNWSWV